MSRDVGGAAKRPRMLERARVGWPRSLRSLKDLLYEAYLEAGAPSLDEIAADIAADDELPGAPSRDTIRRCISEPTLPPSQPDVVSIACVLARRAAWSEDDLRARVRGMWVAARMATAVGRPIGQFDDRLVLDDLEVHPALGTGADDGTLSALPAYVPRAFDDQLKSIVAAALAGDSSIAVLVGGSSTGKTRACWEAVRKLPQGWRLWHPIDPTRPDAVLAKLADIAPRTVVWLNEAQYYLAPETLGEQVAAGLRNLLRERERAPVLVLATLWPDHWGTLSTRTDPDTHPQARALLTGHQIYVPDVFTGTDLTALSAAAPADPRLSHAATQAQDGHITQYLAGVPVLIDRYRQARGTTKALIHAAMDARRLGAGPHIPLAWLTEAAPGYLTDGQWNQTSDDWVQQALNHATQPCNGIPGILTPVKTGALRNQRKGRRTDGATAALHPRSAEGPLYQLADYLDQHGRRHRAHQIPPIAFWTAAIAHAHPADLAQLADAARNRGLARDASQLLKKAITHGDPQAAAFLVHDLHNLHPDDRRPAQWASAHVALHNPRATALLLDTLRKVGAKEQVIALLARDPAAHAAVDEPLAAALLLDALRKAGADEQVTVLAARAAAHVAVDNTKGAYLLLKRLVEARAQAPAQVLAERAAAQAAVDDPTAVKWLLDALRDAAADEQVTVLAERAAARVAVEDPFSVCRLLESLQEAGEGQQVTVLAERAAAHPPLDHTLSAIEALSEIFLLESLRKAGAADQVTVLAERTAARVAVDDPLSVSPLLGQLQTAGADRQATVLAERAAARLSIDPRWFLGVAAGEPVTALAERAAADLVLDNPRGVYWMLDRLVQVGAQQQAAVLAQRAAAHVAVHDVRGACMLLKRLMKAGAQAQVQVLAERTAAQATVDDPIAVKLLLDLLREAGAHKQVALLAQRAAAHPALHNPFAAMQLLDALRKAGAEEELAVVAERAAANVDLDDRHDVESLLALMREAVLPENLITALAERLPAAGLFSQFIEISDHRERFRFGREPDGSAAEPWTWEDVD
ncbi:hypothetical protein [Streptomyces sp. NPDC003710]